MPLWVVTWRLGWTLPSAASPASWHGHEMVLGFAAAVIAGFLLTAVRNWTGRPTATGVWLAALAGLWLLGRAAFLFGGLLPSSLRWLAALVDLSCLPALAMTLALPIVRASNWRNLGFIAMLVALFVGNMLFHLELLARASATTFALDIVVIMIVVMGGRVIPMFSQNGVPGLVITPWRALDWSVLAAAISIAACDLIGPSVAASVVAAVAALLNFIRLIRWQPLRTRRHPLVWVLHCSYAWVIVGLLLKGLAPLFVWVPSTPLHALTVGGLGGIVLGMMARVSLGHTGRLLVASAPMTWAFVLVNLSALTRAVVPLFAPSLYVHAVDLAGALWTSAFCLFLWVYWPILTQPRVDGKPG